MSTFRLAGPRATGTMCLLTQGAASIVIHVWTAVLLGSLGWTTQLTAPFKRARSVPQELDDLLADRRDDRTPHYELAGTTTSDPLPTLCPLGCRATS